MKHYSDTNINSKVIHDEKRRNVKQSRCVQTIPQQSTYCNNVMACFVLLLLLQAASYLLITYQLEKTQLTLYTEQTVLHQRLSEMKSELRTLKTDFDRMKTITGLSYLESTLQLQKYPIDDEDGNGSGFGDWLSSDNFYDESSGIQSISGQDAFNDELKIIMQMNERSEKGKRENASRSEFHSERQQENVPFSIYSKSLLERRFKRSTENHLHDQRDNSHLLNNGQETFHRNRRNFKQRSSGRSGRGVRGESDHTGPYIRSSTYQNYDTSRWQPAANSRQGFPQQQPATGMDYNAYNRQQVYNRQYNSNLNAVNSRTSYPSSPQLNYRQRLSAAVRNKGYQYGGNVHVTIPSTLPPVVTTTSAPVSTTSTSSPNDKNASNQTLSEELEAERSWLQLTSYSKIPGSSDLDIDASKVDGNTIKYNAIEEFCTKTRSSCPPGPVGPEGMKGRVGPRGVKGVAGQKGMQGRVGPAGVKGRIGLRGPPGYDGEKGDIGPKGVTGLDGRDGLAGEPGLDGIPGRNGLDGIPGVDGLHGFNGLPGVDGKDGIDGSIGPQGDKGSTGEPGARGIPGPRGRTGKSGEAGNPGIPGINTWMVNGTEAKQLLIPPSIPGPTKKREPGALVVHEGDHVRLRCAATGQPTPRIEWRREDNRAIATGRWKDASVNEQTLNLTHVRRDHTGVYLCEAYNGVPPNANKSFYLEVHFEPYIRVKEWKVGSFNGSGARMECIVESYPSAISYWTDKTGAIIDNSERHRVYNMRDRHLVWRTTMVLVMNVTADDFGPYYCVAKNSLAITRGSVELYEIDPSKHKPSIGSSSGLSFGPNPPNYSELFEDLCPPPPVCEECSPTPPPPIHGSGFLYCLNIQQLGNYTYPGYSNRTLDCKLSGIGKPVFNRHDDSMYGAWLRDPEPRNNFYGLKYYTASETFPMKLLEYDSKEEYRGKVHSKNYTLPYTFTGNSHVMYNGSFYYQKVNSSTLVRYHLLSATTTTKELPFLGYIGENYLYTESRDYLDLSTDENGLWAIYGLSNNNTVVAKIDPLSLDIEYSWNISLSHHKFGEMFITCGVLYGIDSVSARETKIRFALDLYTTKVLDTDLQFTNPFEKTTTLGYNHRTREIYSWDTGNQLHYPIVYIDIGYHSLDGDGGGIPEYETDVEIERRGRIT